MDRSDWDLIIIGTGAGGGTLAQHLAPTGLRILLIERGGYLPRERENWSERHVIDEGRYRARDTFIDDRGAEFEPFTHAFVGGNTKLYGAALFRLRAHDFEPNHHPEGVSPGWPLRYADFEPYYHYCVRPHVDAGSGRPWPRARCA